jgi:hypothetical protein
VPWKLDVPNADLATTCPLISSPAEGSTAVAVNGTCNCGMRVGLLLEGRRRRVVCQGGFHGTRYRDGGTCAGRMMGRGCVASSMQCSSDSDTLTTVCDKLLSGSHGDGVLAMDMLSWCCDGHGRIRATRGDGGGVISRTTMETISTQHQHRMTCR